MKNSIIFWNSLYIIGFIFLGIFRLEGLLIFIIFKSILFFATCIDGDIEGSTKHFRAYYLNFFAAIIVMLWCLFMGWEKIIKPIYNSTIGKFNKFLNRSKWKTK